MAFARKENKPNMKQNEIIKGVLLSEKATSQQEKFNRYSIEVAPKANKIEIKKAVEDLFNVKVLTVNTQNYAGKPKMLRNRKVIYGSDWKRANVTLKEGDKIDLL